MRALPSGEWSSARIVDGTAILIIAAVAFAAALTFRDYGLGWDDYTHAEMGELLLALYGSGFRDVRALSFVNLYMYGGGFDMLAALAAKLLPFDLFETRRLVGAAVGLVGLFTTWRIGRRVGGPLAGLAALALLATCPLYYGHMFINAKDAPFAVAMAILLLGMVTALQEYPRPSPVTVMLFGVGLGLTIGTRIIGVIAASYAAAALLLILAVEWRASGARPALERSGRFVVALLPGILVGYFVMGLLWPWAVLAPLNPIRALAYFSYFFEKPWKEMFAGALVPVPDMPWSYLPTLFALKLPEVFTLLALGGLVLAGLQASNRSAPLPHRAVLVLISSAALAALLLTIITRPALYNGIRHFVFVLPPFAVLGGVAAAWVAGRAGRPALYAAAAVVAVGILSPVVELVRLHPYEYTHFNRVAGGVKAADTRYMLDYWGLAFKQAAQELRAKLTERIEAPPDGRRWKVAVCGPQRVAAVELGPAFDTGWESQGADFALMLGEFYCRDLKAPILVVVEREGVVYARVYDIRGRSISTLLTIPPP
jgi:dolichyl-phosphate-mannose-protein mannosyltransferase